MGLHVSTGSLRERDVCAHRVRDPGFGFQVSGSGLWVPGFGFRVSGSGFRVSGAGFRVPDSEFRVMTSTERSPRAQGTESLGRSSESRLTNSHTNANSKRWHLWEIDLTFSLNSSLGRLPQQSAARVHRAPEASEGLRSQTRCPPASR